MHLNASLPLSFSTIAAMPSYQLQKSGFCNLLKEADIAERIRTVFETSGLVQFFEKSKDRLIKIASLGADQSPELAIIDQYAQKYHFKYQYFALDNSDSAFTYLRGQYVNPNASYHLVDSSDVVCVQREIPAFKESVDVVLVLQPDIEDEPYPFWKMFLAVIPEIGNTDTMVVASFLQHSEVVRFYEYTKAKPIGDLYSSIICQQTVAVDRYIFASQHQWCATLKLKPDSKGYALHKNEALQQLFGKIVAAPLKDCYTLAALDDISEDQVSAQLQKATVQDQRFKEHTQLSRTNYRPPARTFSAGNL